MNLTQILLSTALAGGISASANLPASAADLSGGIVKHVLLLNVDGLHETDLANFISGHPNSALAGLAARGVR